MVPQSDTRGRSQCSGRRVVYLLMGHPSTCRGDKSRGERFFKQQCSKSPGIRSTRAYDETSCLVRPQSAVDDAMWYPEYPDSTSTEVQDGLAIHPYAS